MDKALMLEQAIQAWESEGGAPTYIDRLTEERHDCFRASAKDTNPAKRTMTGTTSQVEWAAQIKPRVAAEFDRVAKALATVACKQPEQDRADTYATIAILKEKRVQVLGNDRAGYFIRDWQELRDQVSQMVRQDTRFQAIKAKKAARRRET